MSTIVQYIVLFLLPLSLSAESIPMPLPKFEGPVNKLLSLFNYQEHIGPTGATGAQGNPGKDGRDGSCINFGFPHILFVDQCSVASPCSSLDKSGFVGQPFSHLQDAVNYIMKQEVSEIDFTEGYTIFIAPGVYDEDVFISGNSKRISLVALGGVSLKSITWNLDAQNSDFEHDHLHPSLSLLSNGFSGDCKQNDFKIRNSITLQNSSEIDSDFIAHAHFMGDVVSQGIVNMYLERSYCEGNISGDVLSTLTRADNCFFDGVVTVGNYERISSCFFQDGLAVVDGLDDAIKSDSILLSIFALGSSLDGPQDHIFAVDSFTNYWMKKNEVTVTGGAKKSLLFN